MSTLTKITYVCRFTDLPTQLVLAHSMGAALSEAQAQFSMTPYEIEPTGALMRDANDSTPRELESARINHLLLRGDDWCHCSCDHSMPSEVYFRDPDSGYHGWMCRTCRRVTQTG